MISINVRQDAQKRQPDSCVRLLVATLLLGMSSLTQAAPLNLILNDFPDITSSFISVDYNAGTDVLSASGFALSLDDDGVAPAEPIAGGTFGLAASIDDLGAMSGGTLSIGGTIAGLGFNSGILLTGTLSDIGFNNAGDPLEFLFDVTGGDAAGLYGGLGGIILSSSGFGGDWTSDFSTTMGASADVGVIPVPAAIWLFGSGLIGLLGFGRHARRNRTRKSSNGHSRRCVSAVPPFARQQLICSSVGRIQIEP